MAEFFDRPHHPLLVGLPAFVWWPEPLHLGEELKAMTRRSFYLAPLAVFALTGAMFGSPQANAQNETVLAEVYGHGVHAYYAGQYDQANLYLTSAIDGGTRDPRAYYFRGMVAMMEGRQGQADADWTAGAKMEAKAGAGVYVGRSLSRFQGAARLQLESIRQKARIDAMITAGARSDIRMRELGIQPNAQPAPPTPTNPAPATPPANLAPVTPAPPAPAAPVADDPFADDGAAMAGGQPNLDSPDAMGGLDGDPFKDDAPAAAAAGGDAGAGDGMNPFGGGDAAPAADGANPFGGGDDDASPFGGNPFGN